MRAVDRTTRSFVASIKAALPDVHVVVDRSVNRKGGRSNYVFIHLPKARTLKIRISDHPVGMRRALHGAEDLFISAGAGIDRWSVWLSGIVRKASA
jgi:hypothetical protein